MQIRKAKPSDFEAILAIYNQAIPTHQVTGDLELATKENRQQWFDFHLHSEKYPLWSIENEHGVVGWCSFSPFYERTAFQYSSEISIYLDQAVKGKGYGSQIIEFMKNEMASRQIYTLIAYVFELNQVSLNLMKRHHFEYWGKLPHIANMGKDGQGQDKWRSLVIMAYQIAPARG
ncbi:MAG: GNAT family N-acetyltransferase [Pasteurellaceae bacterium]|nr:GNAT family N-acetyltransferase [Pasteurellaceae bacterium]